MFVYLCAIIILLFVGNNVLYYFGYIPTSVITTILPSVYLVLLAWVLNGFKSYDNKNFKKEEFLLCAIYIYLFLMQLIMKSSGFVGAFINILILPIMVSYLYPSTDESFKAICRKYIVLFYCANSFWSIGERILGKNIFPFTGAVESDNVIYSLEGFRSTALQDHPLNNALCLTAIILFILMSSYYSLTKKICLFVLGYAAVLCFNTRSSMILWAIIFAVFVLHFIFSKKNHINILTKIRFLFLVLLLVPIGIYMMLKYNLGDRLLSQKLLDDSAMVRISSLEMFLNLDYLSILVGLPAKKIEMIMYRSNILIIENFWIILFLKYGLIGLVLLIIGFFRLMKRVLKPYSNFQICFCTVFFVLLASTNNSLAVYAQPLCIFILCGYSFSKSRVSFS